MAIGYCGYKQAVYLVLLTSTDVVIVAVLRADPVSRYFDLVTAEY